MVQEESLLRLHVMGLLGLSGWKMLQPGGMRFPVPEEFIYDLGFLALQQQRVATWLSPSPSSMTCTCAARKCLASPWTMSDILRAAVTTKGPW